jgi:hypothetical protein
MPNDSQSWAGRAFQVWPLLTFGARHRHIFTYEELGEHLGLPNVAVGRALDPIYRYCLSKELPLLTLIVVNKKSGKPDNEEFSTHNIPEEQAKVFRYEWFDKVKHAAAVPTVETFKEFEKAAAAANA